MTSVTYAIFLKSHGSSNYKPAGHFPLETAPLRGQVIAFERDGREVCGAVDAVFISPGCEENCVGTVFVSEC
jgi:hypothetical protein